MAHPVRREDRTRRCGEGAPLDVGIAQEGWEALHPIEVGGDKDREHAGQRLGLLGRDLDQPGMGDVRADEGGMGGLRDGEIGGVAALTREEAPAVPTHPPIRNRLLALSASMARRAAASNPLQVSSRPTGSRSPMSNG
ncbi:MAG: hypothetical protein FD152_4535 [Xanthobacteraceae bacterium]|nr:MAG: hypothetical protein FD152_4535 [Xanthobacteraceae bacterium]